MELTVKLKTRLKKKNVGGGRSPGRHWPWMQISWRRAPWSERIHKSTSHVSNRRIYLQNQARPMILCMIQMTGERCPTVSSERIDWKMEMSGKGSTKTLRRSLTSRIWERIKQIWQSPTLCVNAALFTSHYYRRIVGIAACRHRKRVSKRCRSVWGTILVAYFLQQKVRCATSENWHILESAIIQSCCIILPLDILRLSVSVSDSCVYPRGAESPQLSRPAHPSAHGRAIRKLGNVEERVKGEKL